MTKDIYDLEELAELCSRETLKTNVDETFRVNKIYQCGICYTKINKVTIDFISGIGRPFAIYWPTLQCPGIQYEEHGELRKAIKKYRSINEKFKMLEEEETLSGSSLLSESEEHCLKSELQLYKINLRSELSIYKKKIKRLRDLFHEKLDDVVGIDQQYSDVVYFPKNRFSPSWLTYEVLREEKKKLK